MKKARVLLVSPNLKGIVDGITRIQPTMGLLLIAPILQKAGHTVKIYDSALDGWNTRKTLDANHLKVIGTEPILLSQAALLVSKKTVWCSKKSILFKEFCKKLGQKCPGIFYELQNS